MTSMADLKKNSLPDSHAASIPPGGHNFQIQNMNSVTVLYIANTSE